MSVQYPYASCDRFAEPHTYFYTPFQGREFLDAWRASRDAALAELPAPAAATVARSVVPPGPPWPCVDLLNGILCALEGGSAQERDAVLPKLARLTRRYEVSKRLHEAYTERWTPQGEVLTPEAHLAFAEALAAAYKNSHALTYLNALLKILDQLLSVRARLPETAQARLARLVRLERGLVEALSTRVLP